MAEYKTVEDALATGELTHGEIRAALAGAIRALAADAQARESLDRSFWRAVHRGTCTIVKGDSPDATRQGMLRIAAALETKRTTKEQDGGYPPSCSPCLVLSAFLGLSPVQHTNVVEVEHVNPHR